MPKPNLDMHIQALKELADGNASIEEIKDAIRKISLMEPSRDALVDLQASKILPVKFPDGRTRLESIRTDFAIIDRFEYGVAFEGKVSVLNCTLEEVREYRSFLLPLGLGGRYMSKIVEEKSMVTGGDLHPRLSDEFRRKAYALFRYAYGLFSSIILQHTTNFAICFIDVQFISIVRKRRKETVLYTSYC